MKKKLGWFAAFVAVVAVALVARAEWVMSRSYADVPLPPIAADGSPAAVARGEMLFHSLCIECHGGANGAATGKQLTEVPEFLGTFWSANLAHPTAGVRSHTDGELARVLRTGVLPSGRLSIVMNGFGSMGDADVAALLGYLRSEPPTLAPGGELQPTTKLSVAGKLLLTYVAKVSVDRPSSGIEVPAKAPTVAYGKYLTQVLDCGGCHTDGFSADKTEEPGAFAGGFEMVDPTGTPIFTKNLTFDADTGLGRWSVDDFERALTRGATPAGHVVRKPMPLFSRLSRTEVEALYAYLKTVPAVHRENRAGGQPLKRAEPTDSPEVLFVSVGCAACHGVGAPFRDKLAGSLTKTDAELEAWVLDPQATKPGSVMPSFRGIVSSEQANALGRYARSVVQQGAQAAFSAK